MADVEHSTLTGNELHEPKGASTALSGQVYVANGAGSGAWKAAGGSVYGSTYFTLNTNATAIASSLTYVTLDPSTWVESATNGVTFSTDRFIVPSNGVYEVSMNVSFLGGGGGAGNIYNFAFAVNDVAVVASAKLRRQTSSGDIGSGSSSLILPLTALDEVSIQIQNESGTNNPTISEASFSIVQLLET